MKVLFHIGYHKTATTWFQEVLFARDPAFGLIVQPREPWNDSLLSYLIGADDYEWAAVHAQKLLKNAIDESLTNPQQLPTISAERLSGHPFSGGYDSLTLAHRIYTTAPEARIMILVRNQLNAIPSVYRQMVVEGYPGSLRTLTTGSSWKLPAFSWKFFEYDRVLRHYQGLFSDANVRMFTYEQFQADPDSLFDEMGQWLGIDIGVHDVDGVVNRSMSRSAVGIVRLLNHFIVSEMNRTPVIRLPVRTLRRLAIYGGKRGSSSPGLESTMAEPIARRYSDSNNRLREMLEQPLLGWP